MTRLAPAARCAAALSFEVKMPVHSSATSMPRSFHGSFAGSLMAVTLIRPLPMLIASPLTITSPGKRPCTESKRRRCALVSTGARSWMPTRTDIPGSCAPLHGRFPACAETAREHDTLNSDARHGPLGLPKLAQRRRGDPLRRDPEVLVEVLVGRARAERRHPDESAVRADDLVPALPHRSLDRDIDLGRRADDRPPFGGGT